MRPPRFASGGESCVQPVILVAVLLVAVLAFMLPRRRALVPLLAAAFLIPLDQIVVLGPLHWQMLRIVILIGWLRILASRRSSNLRLLSGGPNALDKAITLWAASSAVATVALFRS